MSDEERRLYLAAATRLEQVAADPEASLSDLCHIASRAAFDLPESPARTVLSRFHVNWRGRGTSADVDAARWDLQAASLKLRSQVEEACLG